ncbi:DUF7660 family protein [Neobacillus drentensis]|uniref:DUF7660 family protein n=1 Tax=Neobacillus drentensis TaxID=220684 RepID=UPI002857542A|nr:hypothetical protein [Neobacillus drentensis]MDR7240169.1 hypothetical protein [Neobacillus drentensis]
MELNEKIGSVKNREDLIRFIFHLRTDLQNNREKWGNVTLDDYLEAMEGWISEMDRFYLNSNQPIPNQPSWKTIADILYASSMYE